MIVTAAVVCDHTVAPRSQVKHLILERITAQRPAMTEDDRLAPTPITIVNIGAVTGSNDWHWRDPFVQITFKLTGDHWPTSDHF